MKGNVNYLELANSPLIWVSAAIAVGIVVFQSVLFFRKSLKAAKEIGIEQEKINMAIKSSAISSIGPSIVILVTMISLIVSMGAPVSWMRLSFIGSVNYEASMLAKADIEKEIIKYTEGIQGAIFASGRREYIVFSNSGAVQEEFNQRKLLNLQKKVQEEKKISLNVGIGTGGTMNDAEMNARRALDFSLKNAKQEIFWIDAGQTQHGPLGKEIQLEYQLISSDPKLRKISEKTGLSTTSILKIIAIADVRKSYIFDAHQLAECLGITVRSARRIMNKIMEAGYGKVYAKKTAAAGGRPKALVEILFKI